MRRYALRAVAALLIAVAALLIAACGDDSSTTDVTVTRQAGGDPAAGAVSVNGLGLDLLKANLGLAKGNVALSPWSIATALAMVRLGANGPTAVEMNNVLHAGTGFDDAMNALDQELAVRNGAFKIDDETRTVELAAANRAFAQADLKFQQPYLDGLGRFYGSSLGLVDYRTAAEKARGEINAWVAEQTRKRIPELIARGVLDEMTRLVLVNAVYLKADWKSPFSKQATRDEVFHAPNGDVSVPFMNASVTRRYAEADGWASVELPYAGDKLAMTVVVPDAGNFDAVVAKFDSTLLETLNRAEPVEVDLSLPKFDIEKSIALKGQLSELGMPMAFSDAANFAAMTAEEQLQIADVLHQANVTVDEKGTVAAAATAAVMRTTSAPARIERLVVDRPFVFFVRDLPTGAILFAGQVTNPSSR